MQKVAFGGGCHWCTEAIFESVLGVQTVEQGWIASNMEMATTPSEAVIVHFDASLISLDILTEIHLFTHNATSNHVFRKKYRSAVYTFSASQQAEAESILKKKQKLFTKTLVTKAYPFDSFRLNDEQYLNYYQKNPNKPFCEARIEPKLALLLKKYAKYTGLSSS